MSDVYASIADADEELQATLAGILEDRAADAQQRRMLDSYLSELALPAGATALEVGCGTGPVSRIVAEIPETKEVIGIDPSPVFVDRARQLSSGLPKLEFRVGDARRVDLADDGCDLVVFHTVLCHVPDAETAIREAFRVLRPGGWLALFDGDYTTTTVAIRDDDPLQDAVDAMLASYLHDPWLSRRLPKEVQAAGFSVESFRSHGYTQTTEPTYMLTLIDRGADVLVESGGLDSHQGAALKAEARRRVEEGEFFGHISFVSLIARKPE